jgi:quercetin dioxygenase-like cupin family protein
MTVTKFCTWDDVAPYGDEKADRRMVPGRAGDLKRVVVKAGTVSRRHEHDFEQFFLVQEGTGALTCAAGVIALKPGVVIHFEPHAWHSAVFESDTVLIEVNFAKAEGRRN